jgi:hypothetical protein
MKANALKRVVRQVLSGFGRNSATDSDEPERKIYSQAELRQYQDQFADWQRRNPAKQFKDYYTENVRVKLAEGSARSDVAGVPYQRRPGARELDLLISLGLKPSHICVDYGCATLRVGLHVINYLGRGAYWGFDISDTLFDEARKLVGPELTAEKQPQLRAISPESVREVAAAKPNMLFSVKVMQHVHPNELAEYFGNVMTIIGSSGQAIIGTKWRNGETVQYRPSGWAHEFAQVEALVAKSGGQVAVLKAHDKELPLEGAGVAATGILRIAHKSAPVWTR